MAEPTREVDGFLVTPGADGAPTRIVPRPPDFTPDPVPSFTPDPPAAGGLPTLTPDQVLGQIRASEGVTAEPQTGEQPRGLWDRFMEGVMQGFGERPTGITEEDMQQFPALREQRGLRAAAGAADTALRAPGAVIGGVAGLVSGAAEPVVGRYGADQIMRDTSQVLQTAPGVGVPTQLATGVRAPKAAPARAAAAPEAPAARVVLEPIDVAEPGQKFYDIKSPDGQILGTVYTRMDGNKVTVENIEAAQGANALGPAVIRDVLREYQRLNPTTEIVGGERLSGARFGGDRVPRGVDVEVAVPPAAPPPPPRGRNGGPPLTPDDNAILARLGRQPKEGLDIDPYTQLVDDLHPIKRAVTELENGVTDAVNDPYTQFRLTRGSAGKADHMLKFGTLDFNSLGRVGEPLEVILKPLRGEREQFTAYLLAKAAIENDRLGKPTGIPLAEAQRVVDANRARYEPFANRLYAFENSTLQYAVDAGLVSAEHAANMRAARQAYIPLNRAVEGSRTPKRFNVLNPIKRMRGSEEKILDPLDSIIRNTYTIVEMAERNRAAQTLADFADGALAQKVTPPVRPVHVTAREFTRAAEDMGIPPEMLGDAAGFDVLRRDLNTGLKENEFALYRNGKREVYKTDPDIANAVKSMDKLELGLLDTMAAPFAKTLRAGVTADPGYMGRNIVRDQISAAIQSKHGYRPGIDFVRGLWKRARKGEAYQDFLKSGATQSTLVAQDRNYSNPFLRKYGADRPSGQILKDSITRPIEILQDISETMDNATRLGEYMRATKGRRDVGSVMKGGIAGRDVTQDFQRIGAKIRGWNRIVPFMNGQIQGLDRELMTGAKAMKSPKTAAKYAAKVAAYITIPSVYLWMANKDDPRYQNAPDWEKDQYWFIMPEDPNAPPIRIPRGFTLGHLAGALPDRMLDQYFKDHPQEYDKFAKRVLGTMAPNFIPTLVLPGIEQVANKSMFTGAPLVSQRLEKLESGEHKTNQTSRTAEVIAGGLSKVPGVENTKVGLASPAIVDNYIRQWGGTLGRYGAMVADKGLEAWGAVEKRSPPPERRLSDIPVIKTFISQYPSAGAQPIQDFYEKHDKIEKAFATARMQQKREGGEPPTVTRVMAYKRRLDGQHKLVRETWEDKDLSAREKREIIDKAYLEMLNIAQEGLAVIREAGSIVKKNYGGP